MEGRCPHDGKVCDTFLWILWFVKHIERRCCCCCGCVVVCLCSTMRCTSICVSMGMQHAYKLPDLPLTFEKKV